MILLLVGVVAGWLAGQVWQGTGFGLVGDLIVGVVGAFIGSWVLPRAGVHIGAGLVSAIANAPIGALLLLVAIKLIRGSGRSRWGGGWRFGRSRW